MRKTVISIFLLLIFPVIPLIQVGEGTTYTVPYTPVNYNVLIIAPSSHTLTGSGLTGCDFARYGFNMTYSDANTIDFITDSKTSDLSQYDVVFIQGMLGSDSPVKVSESEVYHFTDYDGILIIDNIALMRNETDGSWFSRDAEPFTSLGNRLGIDFNGAYPSSLSESATFTLKNNSISGLPTTLSGNLLSGSYYYFTNFALNGATEIYDMSIGSLQKGITYYRNGTGAIGIFINYPYTYNDVGTMKGISIDNNENRATMLNGLIAYAKEQTLTTVISPQNMAIWRYDDPTSNEPYDDTQLLNCLNYLYTACHNNAYDSSGTDYEIIPALAYVEGTGSSYPNTLARLQDLEEDNAICIESHFGHEDYRTWNVSQINAQWEIDIAEWDGLFSQRFSYLIVPVGTADYETVNMLSTMSTRGFYIMDLAVDMDWNIHENDTVLVRGVFNIGGDQNFTQRTKATILSNYWQYRNRFALAISNGGVNFYCHPPPFQFDECGTYWIYTIASNFSDQCPVQWVSGHEWGLYAPSYKWATISSPTQSGSTITFTLNVDDVPTFTTIGKGMIWLRIDGGNTIQSVEIDGSDWYCFDDYSIRIPASNCDVQVTLGSPTDPRITDSDREITATSYSDEFKFTVDSLTGTKSVCQLHCGDKEEPKTVSGATSYSYNSTTNILTVNKTHSSSQEIIIGWNPIISASGVYQLRVHVSQNYLPYLGATVQINGENKSTNVLGDAVFTLEYGSYDVTVFCGDQTETKEVLVSRDRSVGFDFQLATEKSRGIYILIALPLAFILFLIILILWRKR